MMMRVLHLLDVCPRGGAETLVLDILRSARSRSSLEAHVAVLTGGVLEAELFSAAQSGIHLGRRGPIDLLSVWRLRKRLMELGIGVIHTHGSVGLMHGAMAVVGTNIRHVHTLHGYSIDVPWRNRLADRLLLRRTDAALPVSEATRVHYSDLGMLPSRVTVVENGVDPEKLDATCVDLREELGWPTDVPLLGMVGNFVNTVRDQPFVCRALVEIAKKGRDFRFAFIGRCDPTRSWLFDECKDIVTNGGINGKVAFLGGRTDVPGILKGLDLFVYASNHDTFGIAVVEAMFTGVPIVVNDLAPFRTISRDGRDLRIFGTGDLAGLIEALESYFDGDPSYKTRAIDAQERAWLRYGIDRVLDDLEDVYRRVVL